MRCGASGKPAARPSHCTSPHPERCTSRCISPACATYPTLEAILAAVTGSDETTLLRETLADRERQLTPQPIIEQAKGMLRHDFDLGEHEAFELLVTISQETNTKLRLLAEELVDALTGTPSARAAADTITQLRNRLRYRSTP